MIFHYGYQDRATGHYGSPAYPHRCWDGLVGHYSQEYDAMKEAHEGWGKHPQQRGGAAALVMSGVIHRRALQQIHVVAA